MALVSSTVISSCWCKSYSNKATSPLGWGLSTISLRSSLAITKHIYSETCLNRTLSKPKTYLSQTHFTDPSTKCLCNLNLSKLNKFVSPKGVRFRQVLLYLKWQLIFSLFCRFPLSLARPCISLMLNCIDICMTGYFITKSERFYY